MNIKVKDINMKIRTYYFFNDIINIINSDPNKIRIGETSYKIFLIYYLGYVTLKEYAYICSVILLYLIFRCVNGSINGIKYLTLVPTNGSKEKV